MPGDVRQGLLDDPVDRDSNAGRQGGAQSVQKEVDLDAELRAPTESQFLDRGQQAEVLEDQGAQIARKVMHLIVHAPRHLAQACKPLDAQLVRGCGLNALEPDQQSGQFLSQFVVQLAGEVQSILLLHFHEALEKRLAFGLGYFAGRYVGEGDDRGSRSAGVAPDRSRADRHPSSSPICHLDLKLDIAARLTMTQRPTTGPIHTIQRFAAPIEQSDAAMCMWHRLIGAGDLKKVAVNGVRQDQPVARPVDDRDTDRHVLDDTLQPCLAALHLPFRHAAPGLDLADHTCRPHEGEGRARVQKQEKDKERVVYVEGLGRGRKGTARKDVGHHHGRSAQKGSGAKAQLALGEAMNHATRPCVRAALRRTVQGGRAGRAIVP